MSFDCLAGTHEGHDLPVPRGDVKLRRDRAQEIGRINAIPDLKPGLGEPQSAQQSAATGRRDLSGNARRLPGEALRPRRVF